MDFTTLKIPGKDAIRILNDYRTRYQVTGQYPFLIGDCEESERIGPAAEFWDQDCPDIIRASLSMKTADWIASRRKEAKEYEFSDEETLGEWPGEILEKGSICLHKDGFTGMFKREVYLGLAKIEKP
jgi:hypothetical protein